MNHEIFLEEPVMSQEFPKKFQPLASNSNFSTESANSRIEISRDNIVEPKMLSGICAINEEVFAKNTSGILENLRDRVEYLDQNSILLRSGRVIYFENSRSRNPSNEDMFNPSKSDDFANIKSKSSENWAEEVSRRLSLKNRSHILRQYANVNRRLTRRTTRAPMPGYGYSANRTSHLQADNFSGNESRFYLPLEKMCSPVLLSEEAYAIMPFEEIESPC
uniref:Uncharacterized protein n=1 Tax=Romanomermis culicivorax TaxID=13658 RepID=A0A915IGH1_ROMCU